MRRLMLIFVLMASFGAASSQNGKFEYVESGVTLRLLAPLTENGAHRFVLGIQTNDVYECENTYIENRALLQGNKILIKVKGVRIPEPCVSKMGPARSRVDMSSLKQGKYPVRVSINRQVFKATLEVASTYFDFEIDKNEDPSLFRIYNGRLNLIPANSIWGVCEYTEANMKGDALKFMKRLQEAGATLTQLEAGNYDDFYLHQAGVTEEKIIAADRYEYPFVFGYTGDAEKLKEIANAYIGKVNITLKTSSGLVIKNF